MKVNLSCNHGFCLDKLGYISYAGLNFIGERFLDTFVPVIHPHGFQACIEISEYTLMQINSFVLTV